MSAPYANPLLVEWVEEIYDLAKERNTKGVNQYKRAYESIKACPMRLDHPSQAEQLAGIGPKISDRLTKKMEEYCKANGLPSPKKPRGKARKRLSTEDVAETEEVAPVKKPRKAKPYVPSLKSGPYAIILALSSLPEDSLESLSKAQLIDLAQPHCDSSFSAPSEANKFYTAWNSMKTLLEKDLVHERGRPLRKYALTDEGWEVARRIRAVQENDSKIRKGKTTTEELPDESNPGEGGKASYVSDGIASFLHFEDDDKGFGHIVDMTAPPRDLDILNEINTKAKSSDFGQRLGGAPADKYGTSSKPKDPQCKISESKKPPHSSKRNVINLSSSPEPQPDPDIPWTSVDFAQDARTLVAQPASEPNPPQLHRTLHFELEKPKQPPKDSMATDGLLAFKSNDLPNFTPITIAPGTFTVELVLDNREVRTKEDRKYISNELTKKGITPLVRELELADFFWVAKLNSDKFLPSHGEEGDEIALDWIVERKRLDDLLGSIHDGRFVEQKFRLRKSGVKNVIYLVEQFTMDKEVIDKFGESLQTAIASTQVINGYIVKQTRKLDDTIRYLARMTRMLKSLYEFKPLHLIPTSALTASNYLPLLTHLRTNPAHADKSFHITYPSFASLASKSDTLTLRDVFLKMLLCTKGISGDKALAIQKHWETPRAFIEAFERCETKKQREALIESKLGNIAGRGKVKGILAAKVARVWGEE